MATVVGDSLAYKPPTSHHAHPNPVSSSGQTIPMSRDASNPADTSLMYEISSKRKKMDLDPETSQSMCALPDTASLSNSNQTNENGNMDCVATSTPSGSFPCSGTNDVKRVCTREEQPEVLDLTITTGNSAQDEKDRLSGSEPPKDSPSFQPATSANALDSFPLFASSLGALNSSNAIISSSNLPTQAAGQVPLAATHDMASIAPPPVGLAHQAVMHPLGLFGPPTFGVPFSLGPGTTVPSVMIGGVPVNSVTPNSNSLYGNQFCNGLFPSNPFHWTISGLGTGTTTTPQLSLPPLPMGCISTTPSSSSFGLEFSLASMTPPSLVLPQLSDPAGLLNGLSNGNKLPDDVKPDLLAKELLAWSQAMSHLQQGQKTITDGNRQTPLGNSESSFKTQDKAAELNEGVAASPGDEFSQSDCFDVSGDLNSVKVTNPIRKYGSFEECSSAKCQSSGIREHYHCQSCEKIIIRREEMIRHAKWHRKREESLQYGFMRYSPGDNCAVTGCAHNGRQTHYHCLQPNCSKVYISTSDVQMHANFHRKDAVIIQEGFQRFRASENCGVQACPFYQERTTHFHCRRPNCHFTFKNKADMEKHKLHHQKNDNFAKDGFRKFIKCETCGFTSCKYSGIINHIHCIRPGCDYVVHSSSQILSHKRKHDRRFSHLTPRHNDPTLLSDLSNLAFDSASRTGPSQSQSHQSPYDLSPTTEFGEPLDMKCYPLSSRKPDEEVATPLTSSENSPVISASRDVRSPVHETGSSTQGIGDKLLNRVTWLFDKCLHSRQELSSTSEQAADRTCNLGLLFTQQSTIMEEVDDNWKIEGESMGEVENQDNEQECSYSAAQNILQLINHFHVYQTKNAQSTEAQNSSSMVSNPASCSACNWPLYSTESTIPPSGELLDQQPAEDNETAQFCRYWHQHVWQASVLKCGLSPCTLADSNCYPQSPEESHAHCCFWPSCGYKVKLSASNLTEPFDHLLLHDTRLARPVSGSRAQATLDDATPTQPPSPYVSTTSTSVLNVAMSRETLVGQQPRRRGRPPKYTKYIRVPRLQIPDELCTDNYGACELTRTAFFSEKTTEETTQARILGGVKLYLTNEQCPDDLCDYSIQRVEHYHCVRPRCFMASESLDLMNVHRREFHKHIKIAPGFEHFDRSVDCRRPTCHNKRMSQHYHCTYPNCDYAFIRPSTMLQHARKHEEVARARRLGLNHTAKKQPLQNQVLDMDKLSVRQAAIDQLSKPATQVEKPPFLPLGLSPLVAAQLPTIFPQASSTSLRQSDQTMYNIVQPAPHDTSSGNTTTQPYPQNVLPGFLPIWAAAMAAAAAAAAAKQPNGASEGTAEHKPGSDDKLSCQDGMSNENKSPQPGVKCAGVPEYAQSEDA